MRKAAIITLNGYFNYGNRLQNYALQEVIKQLGFEVETILHHELPHVNNETKIFNNVKRLARNLNPFSLKRKISNKMLSNKKKYAIKYRIPEFKKFTEKYIKETNFTISSDNIPDNLANKYEYFVVGSDQVWNPFYQKRENILPAIEYLTFAPKEKRLSYAASFGITSIPEKFIPRVRNGLMGMKSILVREHAGIEIVKKLTGRKAHVVLDPTMLLTKEKWLSIAKPHNKKPRSKYLLTYFLGKISKESASFINQVAEEYDLEVIHLENYEDIELFKADPSHFIDFINSASIFLTDSFHGVAFSIVLETPFIVFEREENGPSMYSRIETLLQTFDLENRQYIRIKKRPLEWMAIDFTKAKEILNEERRKSLFLFRNSFIQ